MQAIQLAATGGPEVLELEELPEPNIQPGEVLVKIDAIGLNYVDTLIRKGKYPVLQSFPAIMAGEIEGVITSVSKDITQFHPGQRVTGYTQAGYAQFASISADQLTVLPDDLPIGRGMLIQHLSAQNLLHQASGYKSVLVTAAAGGVGSSAICIARIKNIPMIAGLLGNMQKAPYIQSLGATHAISYLEENWFHQLKEIPNNNGFDLILDSVGGVIGSALVELLAPGGTLVVYGNSSGQPSSIDLQSIVMPAVKKITGARLNAAPAELKTKWTKEIFQWITSEQLNVAATFYPLADAASAHRDMENRTSTGRLILLPW
jgi:NADPH2:quinone reductase